MTAKWSPPWCNHVEAEVRPRGTDPDEGEPLRVRMRCLVCHAYWQLDCYSGKWDRRVAKFALNHVRCWYEPVPLTIPAYQVASPNGGKDEDD